MVFKAKKPAMGPVFFLRLIKPERDFGRSDWIRTSDLLVPNETRYQAALRSEDGAPFYIKSFASQASSEGFFTSAKDDASPERAVS